MEYKISKASSFLQRVLYCVGVCVGGGEVTMEAQNGASSGESARILEDKAPDLLTSQILAFYQCKMGGAHLAVLFYRLPQKE